MNEIILNRPLTKREVARIGINYCSNYYEKYHEYIIKTYKYRGQVKTRKDLCITEKGRAIGRLLADYKIFRCPVCGEKKHFCALEWWLVDGDEESFINDECDCSLCYEAEMGDDL